ncbi:MAG: hypothetical protein K5757_11120, partial [Bacteroidaceae bacterium]|nr:hypothetical protein [Bacteroidaceae bacterium]
MKKILLLATTALLIASCSSTSKKQDIADDTIGTINVDYNPHSFLVTDSLLPERIDLKMDISDMTMM